MGSANQHVVLAAAFRAQDKSDREYTLTTRVHSTIEYSLEAGALYQVARVYPVASRSLSLGVWHKMVADEEHRV